MAPLPQGISTRPIILTPLEALSVTEPNRQWTGRGRQSQAEGDPVRVWWIFAALPRHPAGASKRRIWCAALFLRAAKPTEAATNCGLLVAPNRWLRARHGHCLILPYITVPPRRPRTNTLRDQLQTTSEQDSKASQTTYPKGDLSQSKSQLR